MASPGILGFFAGAGEAGGKFAQEAQQNQYREAAAERLEHNEQTRLRMAAALEQSQAERDQGYARENYALTRQDQVEDRDLTRGDLAAERERASKAAAAAAQLEAERYDTDHQRKVEIERMKQANKAGSYSDIMVGVNKDTGERDQYRVNNRTGAKEWLGVGVPTNPLDDAKLAKAQSDAEIASGKVTKAEQDRLAGIEVTKRGIQIADEILDPKNSDPLERATGNIESKYVPTFRQSTSDMENRLRTFKAILTKENLGIMSGVLSETDMKVISDISAGQLDPSNSKEVVFAAVQAARDALTQGLRRSTSSEASPARTQPAPGTRYKNMSDEESIKATSAADLSDDDIKSQLGL